MMMVLMIMMKLVMMVMMRRLMVMMARRHLKKRSNSPSWRSGATITASSPTFGSWLDDAYMAHTIDGLIMIMANVKMVITSQRRSEIMGEREARRMLEVA